MNSAGQKLLAVAVMAACLLGGRPLAAQDSIKALPRVDSLEARGFVRNTKAAVLTASGLSAGSQVTFLDLERATIALVQTGQFDDVQIEQSEANGKLLLTIVVKERPLLVDWAIVGSVKYTSRALGEFVHAAKARPIDREAIAHARYAMDSVYTRNGYLNTRVTLEENVQPEGVTVTFHVAEGSRMVISKLEVVGNSRFSAGELAAAMATRPEGFLWTNNGKYDEQNFEYDIRERLPQWYGQVGMIDFQVIRDSLILVEGTGKATLRLEIEEGQAYNIGIVDVVGNQHFSLGEIEQVVARFGFAQAGSGAPFGVVFNQSAWDDATTALSEFYQNNGYITSEVTGEQIRRIGPDGKPVLDLRWNIREDLPAHINRIDIVGNNVTRESVVRDAIVLIPGQLYSREALIRSYQNIANLGFFQQPMPEPQVRPLNDGTGAYDITFVVEEKRTGTINFGASVGQGTGLGGFLSLEEPNLFGRGKRGKVSWNFGKNVNDFSLSYADPAVLGTRISGNITLYNSRQKYIIGDLGRQRQEGVTLQVGLPFLGSRYSRVFGSYGFQRVRYDEGSAELQARYNCTQCSRSTIGGSFVRETRIGLPFPVDGSMVSVAAEQNGGILGGTGNYQKIDLDSRWFTPLGRLGGSGGAFGGGVQFTLGITAKSGFIFGNPGGFFTQLYSLGGVQYGIPLRGYDEFSITPNGFDPNNGGTQGSANAFGKSYAAATVEFGARVSQSIYLSTFYDVGNVYRTAKQYDPTRLFRGVGVGVGMLSPLGAIGADIAYGFDKIDAAGRPNPGFQVHLRLGNIGN